MTREQIIETMARAMAEDHIRIVRRWDTAPAKIEETLPRAIEYCWRDFAKAATAALSALEAAGFVVVPVEPGEMVVRNRELKGVTIHDFPSGTVPKGWRKLGHDESGKFVGIEAYCQECRLSPRVGICCICGRPAPPQPDAS